MFFTHSSSWKSVKYMTTKMLHRLNTSNILACARTQIAVFMCTVSYVTVCFCCVCMSVASLLLQQGRDVDVPADGLSVEAAGEQVARLVLFIPRRTTHHSPVTHSVAAWKSGQPHSTHIKQSDLSIVVWQSDDLLVGRDAYPIYS